MKNSRVLLTSLLFVACISTGAMLIFTPAKDNHSVSEISEIDGFIVDSIEEFGVERNQYRTFQVDIDTSFSRKIYRIEVSPDFSKTSFHLKLHHKVHPYGITTPARVTFPEEDMEIHFFYNQTVFRTIRLITKEVSEPSG